MGLEQFVVIDCDQHLLESIPEMAEHMDPSIRKVAIARTRDRQGVFPTGDAIHYPEPGQPQPKNRAQRVTASKYREGSGEDCAAFLEKANVYESVLFATEGLSVGYVQQPVYATLVCRAYNDYVAERYKGVSPRLHPMALLPMQDPKEAVVELRRAVKHLGLLGGTLPSTGLPLHLGHEYYWPVYEEAANLGCTLGVHGGFNIGIGINTFTSRLGSRLIHHPLPLMIALTSFIYHGVFDRYPGLRVGFLEGGCGWVVCLLDRMERDAELEGPANRTLPEYLASGQVLIGCEGNDGSLPYLVKRAGVEAFAFSSDYPHETDLPAARHMIEEALKEPDLSPDEKAAVLGGNAKRFYGL